MKYRKAIKQLSSAMANAHQASDEVEGTSVDASELFVLRLLLDSKKQKVVMFNKVHQECSYNLEGIIKFQHGQFGVYLEDEVQYKLVVAF